MESLCAPSKMQPRKLRMMQGHAAHLGGPTGDEVDDAVGQTSFFENPHYEIVGIDCYRRGFPNDDIARYGRSCRQVASDGGKVEGGNSINEGFQWSILAPVNDSLGRGGRLIGYHVHV